VLDGNDAFCDDACVRAAKCGACKTLLNPLTTVTAATRKWHSRCFVCHGCGCALSGGDGYSVVESRPSEPYCGTCIDGVRGSGGNLKARPLPPTPTE
jgi:hypothetical protein